MIDEIVKLTPLLIGIIGFVGTYLQMRHNQRVEMANEKEKNRLDREREKARDQEELRLIRESLEKREEHYDSQYEVLKQGTNSMIRNSISKICREAAQNQYIDIYTLEVLSGLYHSYKALGGNSIIEDLYMRTKDLPQVDERDIMNR